MLPALGFFILPNVVYQKSPTAKLTYLLAYATLKKIQGSEVTAMHPIQPKKCSSSISLTSLSAATWAAYGDLGTSSAVGEDKERGFGDSGEI